MVLEGLKPLSIKKPCRVQVVADQLDETDRQILMDAIGSPMVWNPTNLEKALGERGVKLPRYHIEKHRAGDCFC